MDFDPGVITRNLSYLLWGRLAEGDPGGLLLTILMAVSAGALALVAGVGFALAAWRCPGTIRRLLFLSADLIRGIPLIFIIFWLYFLLPALLGGDVPGAAPVILALAWFSSAAVMYSTLAGLEALPKGQREAALASGLSEGQALRWVLLPQTLRNVMPSYVALLVSLVKDTSLAFIVNVTELSTLAGQVNNRTQLYPMEIFLFTAALYFLLCRAVSLAGGRLARLRH
ncbi:MAG: amino acid ABC transporter permease [Telmatospirillum sp.]|nr:amino acid ABC transporter permease [Telmatospirillum sp.]